MSTAEKKRQAQKRKKMALASSLAALSESKVHQISEHPADAPILVEPPRDDVGRRLDERIANARGAASAVNGGNSATGGGGEEDAAAVADALATVASKKPTGQLNQRKRLARVSVDELKKLCARPDLVEIHDANAPDPVFFLHLKSARNTVQVPRHWCQKSNYMSHVVTREGDSTESVVPSYIEATNVAQMRPKNAKVDLAALARPFLAGHPKPVLSGFGDVFYEGKDSRARYRRFRPGAISDRLRAALGLTGSSANAPPPWLYGMQRLAALPPSYPTVKIPGMNAPIPPGCRFGRGRNEWGEPPRDKTTNQFLWPEVGQQASQGGADADPSSSSNEYWGVLPESLSVTRATEAPTDEADADAPPAAQPAADPKKDAPPTYVLPTHLQPEFGNHATSAMQTPGFAVEMGKVQTAYADGGGLMPTSHIYVQQQQQGANPYDKI